MSQFLHRRLRRTYNDEGHAHFLTFSCWKRLPLLSKDRSREWFVEALAKSLKEYNFGCWAYVIMPEHVHLLVYPHAREYKMGNWVASLKLLVTHRAVKYLRQHQPSFLEKLLDSQPNGRQAYRFWQPGGGVDVNLWTEAKIWEKIDYIHNNPVRRGLVVNPGEWRWSSYPDYANARTVGPVAIDWDTLPQDSREG